VIARAADSREEELQIDDPQIAEKGKPDINAGRTTF
jgi:hypothetical protein